jgi:phenylpropionate dioxygenase-like ring-hydroxylating dioxygenase large terminal subunit
VLCLDDWCPHRGAPLSGGEIKVEPTTGHTCVACPYHGWAFDAEGRLRDVPSAEPGRWPKRPLVSGACSKLGVHGCT